MTSAMAEWLAADAAAWTLIVPGIGRDSALAVAPLRRSAVAAGALAARALVARRP
jgi:hypothetical protein